MAAQKLISRAITAMTAIMTINSSILAVLSVSGSYHPVSAKRPNSVPVLGLMQLVRASRWSEAGLALPRAAAATWVPVRLNWALEGADMGAADVTADPELGGGAWVSRGGAGAWLKQ